MKRILLFACVALLAWACSKDEDYDTPPLDVQEDSLWDNIIKAISDTTGLKLYGMGSAYIKDDTLACALGTKYGKIWCGFFSEIQSEDLSRSSLKEEFVYVGSEDLIDSLVFEVGYGETSTVVFTDENDPYGIRGSFFNEEEFAICKYGGYNNCATIFVNRDDVVYKHLFLDRLWYDGYYMGVTWLNGREQYSIFDLNGEPVYDIEDRLSGEVIPISLYDYVSTSNSDNVITVERVQLPAGTIVWSQTLSVGKTINGNAPRVTYSKSLEGRYIHIEATAVNYDGSKETKSFKIDIETGEMEE